MSQAPCKHREFRAETKVTRLVEEHELTIDVTPLDFSVDVKIQCNECGRYLSFIGLPAGYKFNGATVSADGEEARLKAVFTAREPK